MNIRGEDYGVPDYVEHRIRYQAVKWARRHNADYVSEDLAQEARIEAWKLVCEGETNIRYILADTREAIRDASRLGRSVDGRIYRTWNRPNPPDILTLELPETRGEDKLKEVLIDPYAGVERQAGQSIMVDEIAALLDERELEYFEERLEGGFYIGVTRTYPTRTRDDQDRVVAGLKEKVARYLGREDLLNGRG